MRNVVFLLALSASAVGCNMTQLAVETQGEVMELASPVIEEQSDYEMARDAIPATLLQVDGLLRVAPYDERLLFLGAKGYASYAYGFIEDDKEAAEQRGDLARADVERARARDAYLKARDFGVRLLERHVPEIEKELKRDPDALKLFLATKFKDRAQAAALFWTGNAWGSAINVSRDDPALVADLALVNALVERSVELDEAYYNAAGHIFLGVVNSSMGESIGGDPEKARQHFERALALTRRQATLVQVNYAQFYAVQKQDKKLFVDLLNEALFLPIPKKSTLALPNTVARRRAERLLAQADNLILEPLPETPEAPSAPEPAAPPAPADLGPLPAPATPASPATPTSAPKSEKKVVGAPG